MWLSLYIKLQRFSCDGKILKSCPSEITKHRSVFEYDTYDVLTKCVLLSLPTLKDVVC